MKNTAFKKWLLAAVAAGSVIVPAMAGAQDYGRRGNDDSSSEDRRAERAERRSERAQGERSARTERSQGERPQGGERQGAPQGPRLADRSGPRPDRGQWQGGDRTGGRPVRQERNNYDGGRPVRPDRSAYDGGRPYRGENGPVREGPRRDRPDRQGPARQGQPDRPNRPDRTSPSRGDRAPRTERRAQYRNQVRHNWNRDSWRRNWNSRHNRNWWRNHRWWRGWNGIRFGFFFAPGYGYYNAGSYYGRHFYEGDYLPSIFWRYRVIDPYFYGLPPAPPGCAWIYVDNNILLVDLYDGYIIEVISQAWYW